MHPLSFFPGAYTQPACAERGQTPNSRLSLPFGRTAEHPLANQPDCVVKGFDIVAYLSHLPGLESKSSITPTKKEARRFGPPCSNSAFARNLDGEILFALEDGQRLFDRSVSQGDGGDGLRQANCLVQAALVDVAARGVTAGAPISSTFYVIFCFFI